VHPIACLLTLACFLLATAAHFHSASHSSRYLLALIILILPTLLISLLAFLVDILLFVPHLNWAGWIVLAATILIVLAGIMLCAMRRTLVSRKARKKRIAENAEMSGENFYNRQAQQQGEGLDGADPHALRADSPPPLPQPGGMGAPMMLDGASGGDKLPQLATYDGATARRISDDQLPLNEQRTMTATTASSGPPARMSDDGGRSDGYGTGRAGPALMGRGGRGGARAGYGPPRDEFGNPLPSSPAFGPNANRPSSYDQGRGGYGYGPGPGSRGGRGGYPPRGGHPGYPGYGRGPAGPPNRDGPPMGALAGEMGRRGPPPGYTNDPTASYPLHDRAPPNGSSYSYGAAGPRRQSPGPQGYGRGGGGGSVPPGAYRRQQSPGARSASAGPAGYASSIARSDPGAARAESPPPMLLAAAFDERPPSLARAESPPPLDARLAAPPPPPPLMIGQAIEMDARTGSPAQSPHIGAGAGADGFAAPALVAPGTRARTRSAGAGSASALRSSQVPLGTAGAYGARPSE